MIRRYVYNGLIALDQTANVLLAPALNWALRPTVARFGDPDETISSVMGKNIRAGACRLCKPICRLLSATLGPQDHCGDAIADDEGKDAL